MSEDDADPEPQDSPFRDRPALPQDQALHLLRTAELDVLGRMPWSSNGTFLCDLSMPDEDEPAAQAIYKPHAGEQPLWDFPSGLFKREVACFELSRALGWDLVPPTVLRDGALGPGSLQLFVPCDFSDHYFTLQDEPQYRPAFERLAAFDFIANSTDRKSGHVLLGKDDKIHAIDNGLSFHVEFKLRTVLWDFAGEPIPQDIVDDMAAFVAAEPTTELGELLDTLELDAMVTRARALISEGRFPTDPSGRRWPWPLV